MCVCVCVCVRACVRACTLYILPVSLAESQKRATARFSVSVFCARTCVCVVVVVMVGEGGAYATVFPILLTCFVVLPARHLGGFIPPLTAEAKMVMWGLMSSCRPSARIIQFIPDPNDVCKSQYLLSRLP